MAFDARYWDGLYHSNHDRMYLDKKTANRVGRTLSSLEKQTEKSSLKDQMDRSRFKELSKKKNTMKHKLILSIHPSAERVCVVYL